MNLQSNNELIREFVNGQSNGQYYNSWDNLKVAIKKCLDVHSDPQFYSPTCSKLVSVINDRDAACCINTTFKAVADFVKWYNNKKQKL